MKRLSIEKRRQLDDKGTAATLSIFMAIVPFLCFYAAVNLLDRSAILPKNLMDQILGRVEEGVTPTIGLAVYVGAFFCSYLAAYMGIRRTQRWYYRRKMNTTKAKLGE